MSRQLRELVETFTDQAPHQIESLLNEPTDRDLFFIASWIESFCVAYQSVRFRKRMPGDD